MDKLNPDQKIKLKEVLRRHPTLFGGGLGRINVPPIHLELKPGAKPYHARAFPIPHAYEGTT
jgi:hypothetical protein